MKPTRIVEIICVPVALGCVGWYAVPCLMKLLRLLGRTYMSRSVTDGTSPILLAIASGFLAGVAAVVAARKRETKFRWFFYVLQALSVLIGAAFIFAIEAVWPRMPGAFGIPPVEPDISSVPWWVLAVGFWLPFLVFLRKKKPNQPSEPPPLPVTPT